MSVISRTEHYGLTVYGGQDIPAFLKNISEDNEKIDRAIDDATVTYEEVAEIDARLTTAEENISANTATIEGVTDRVCALETEVEALEPQSILALENKVQTNSDNIASLEDMISDTIGDVTALTRQVATNTTNISTNASAITALQSAQSSLESSIQSVRSDLTTLSTNVDTSINALGSRMNSAESAIAMLQSEDITITAQLQAVSGQLTTILAKIESIEVELADHEARIQALENT